MLPAETTELCSTCRSDNNRYLAQRTSFFSFLNNTFARFSFSSTTTNSAQMQRSEQRKKQNKKERKFNEKRNNNERNGAKKMVYQNTKQRHKEHASKQKKTRTQPMQNKPAQAATTDLANARCTPSSVLLRVTLPRHPLSHPPRVAAVH